MQHEMQHKNRKCLKTGTFRLRATGLEPAFYAPLRSVQNRGPPDLVNPLRPNALFMNKQKNTENSISKAFGAPAK